MDERRWFFFRLSCVQIFRIYFENVQKLIFKVCLVWYENLAMNADVVVVVVVDI